jgi:hypothetical protein
MRNWRRLVLETTPKPFYAVPGQSYDETAKRMMQVWTPLIRRSGRFAILLFIGDGNEVFEWSGSLDQRLEWARYVGFCNLGALPDLYHKGWYDNRPGVPFRDDLPDTRYADLKAIIDALKSASLAAFGKACEIGVAIDPGPEFSTSRFKYQDHPEVLVDYTPNGPRSSMRFVDTTKTLNPDTRKYGAFPNGIDMPTSFGTFFGRQFASFRQTFGVDYIWFSNGLGYSAFAWSTYGHLFHGGRFRPESAKAVAKAVIPFWTDFKAANPDVPIEVRGTDSSVGHDISVHGASHLDIQAAGQLDAEPCNLPVLRAELLAKEVMVYLTRLAGAPGERVIYRNYLNDPWFPHDPWEHIYDREPFEIYAAMSCGRLRADGSMLTPTDLHILSIDCEQGRLSEDQANEVIPHYLRALREPATNAGPVTWVYPFATFDSYLKQQPESLPQAFFHDHLIWRSIEGGLPLNTVVHEADFVSLIAGKRLPRSVYLVPVIPGFERVIDAALQHARDGGEVIFVGSLKPAPQTLLDALELKIDPAELSGDFDLGFDVRRDRYASEAFDNLPLRHEPVTSGGGLGEVTTGSAKALIRATQGSQERAYATVRAAFDKGRIAWLRGTVPFGPDLAEPHLRPVLHDPTRYQRSQDLLRLVLSRFGWVIQQDRLSPEIEPTRWFVKSRDGGLWFFGSKADTTVTSRLRVPDGAPIFTGLETQVENGQSIDPFGKTIYNEVRFFVQTDRTARFIVRRVPEGSQYKSALTLEGCAAEDTLIICLDRATIAGGRYVLVATDPGNRPLASQVTHDTDPENGRLIVRNHTGPLIVKWS